MAQCLLGITAGITNDCTKQPVRGIARSVMIGNRADFSFTEDGSNSNLITAIANDSTKQFYNCLAYRMDIDAGSDLVVADNLPESYTHMVSLQPWDQDADSIKNLDNLEDLVFIVEAEGGWEKDSGDGAFQIYGLRRGLFKSSMVRRRNDNNGVPIYEFASREGQTEPHSVDIFFDTDYATTKTAFDALTTPGV